MIPVDLDDKPLITRKKKVEQEDTKSSPLSMRTGDLLTQIESAGPGAAHSMMRALGSVERQRQRSQGGIEQLHRKREMEIVAEQKKPEQIMSRPEWVRANYPDLWAKRGGNVTPREMRRVKQGYEAYRVFMQDRQEASFKQAQIGRQQALTSSAGRANRPNTIASYIARQLQSGGPIDAQAIAMWNSKHSKQPGLESRERIAAAGDVSRQQIAGMGNISREGIAAGNIAGRETIAVGDRASRERIAALKGPTAAKQTVKTQRISEAGQAAIEIGKSSRKDSKTGESLPTMTFESWMQTEYMPIAAMTTSAQRATLRKALGRRLPSIEELEAMIVAPKGTPAQPGKNRIWPLSDVKPTAAAPPTPESVEGAWSNVDMVIEALRLHGEPDEKIARWRALFSNTLLNARPGAATTPE